MQYSNLKLHLGHVLPHAVSPVSRFFSDDPEMAEHLGKPWLNAYFEERFGLKIARAEDGWARPFLVPSAVLAKHTFIVGKTGSGKSETLRYLFGEHVRSGGSAVLLDPKGSTIEKVIPLLHDLRVPPEKVLLIDPRRTGNIPGWNIFLEDTPLQQIVGDMVALIRESSPAWGARMNEMITQGLLVIGTHRLSWYELVRLLSRADYRGRLLETPVPGASLAYREARDYFLHETESWGRSEWAHAVSTVTNRVREMVRSDFLGPLLNAQQNTVSLRTLWQGQQILLVRLDRPSLGEAGATLLALLLILLLFRTSLRKPGDTPVLLAIDELASVSRMVSGPLVEIVTIAREQNLRLAAATQTLNGIPEELRSTLMGNAACKIFMQLGGEDARRVAGDLAVGSEPRLDRVTVSAAEIVRETGSPVMTEWRHPVLDARGKRMRVTPWNPPRPVGPGARSPLDTLEQIARACGRRLYVLSPETRESYPLREYLRGLRPGSYRFEGPDLTLVVSFPRPKFSGLQRVSDAEITRSLARTLQDLPVQGAVVSAEGSPPQVIRIVDVPSPHKAASLIEPFWRAIETSGGQGASPSELYRLREAEIERVIRGQGSTRNPTVGRPEDPSTQIFGDLPSDSDDQPSGSGDLPSDGGETFREADDGSI